MRQTLFLILAMNTATVSVLAGLSYYVSPVGRDVYPGTQDAPFATLRRARDAVRDLPAEQRRQHIRVLLRGGAYRIDETIVFGLRDSAPDGYTVSYEAYPDETPVLSAGLPVTGWKRLADPPAALPEAARGHVWMADLPRGAGPSLTLFDGDRRLPRARGPAFQGQRAPCPRADSMNVLHAEDRHYNREVVFEHGEIKNWPNLSDIEVVFDPVPWCMNFIDLASVDEARGIAELACEANSPPFTKSKMGAWVENVIDYLNAPGNWVVNRQEGRVYYWPEDGEPSDDIVVPALHELVRVEGDIRYDAPEDVPVKNLVFKGLTFKHGERSKWQTGRKGWGIQHDWDTFDHGNAMLRFRGAEDCRVTECRFTASGGSGVRCDLHAQRIRIDNCLFDRVGHMGVLLAGYGPGTKHVNRDNVIENNIFHRTGEVIWHGHAIYVWQSGGNRIAHNWIHDVPRKAIGVGGPRGQILMKRDCDFDEASKTIRWDEIEAKIVREGDIQEQFLPFLHARDNVIEDNKVARTLLKLGDGAAINVSGAGPDNIVRHNLVFDVHSSAFRTDDWQRYTTMESNIVYRCGTAFVHKDCNHIVNNIVVNPGEAFIRFRLFPKQTVKLDCDIQRNILYSDRVLPKPFSGKTNLRFQTRLDANLYAFPGAQAYLDKERSHGVSSNSLAGDPAFRRVGESLNTGDVDLRFSSSSPASAVGFVPFSVDIGQFGITDTYPQRYRRLDALEEQQKE